MVTGVPSRPAAETVQYGLISSFCTTLKTPEDTEPLTIEIPPDIAAATPPELQVMLREMTEECDERDRNRRNTDVVKAGWE